MRHCVGNQLDRLVLRLQVNILAQLANVLKLEEAAILAVIYKVLHTELRGDDGSDKGLELDKLEVEGLFRKVKQVEKWSDDGLRLFQQVVEYSNH